MATTFFNLKPTPKKQVIKPVEKNLVELKLHKIDAVPESMTYIDKDGKEKPVTGSFSKTQNGTYFLTKNTSIEHDIYEKNESTYLDEHFSYIDKDGKYRVFNKLDTLEYDENTNTYTGLVEDIEYIKSSVEVFTKED